MDQLTRNDSYVPLLMKLCFLLLLVTSASAEARRGSVSVCFGTTDHFYDLGELKVSDQQVKQTGMPVEWTSSEHQFGIHLQDHCLVVRTGTEVIGYAIYKKNSSQYWALDDTTIQTLQKFGVLPNPMPPLEVPVDETVGGEWLWALAILAGLVLIGALVTFVSDKQQRRVVAKVDKVLNGNFVLLLREVLVDVARMDRNFDANKPQAILAIMQRLGFHDSSLATLNSDAVSSGKLSRKLLIAYIKAVAGNLNDQQRNILLTGIATVISAEGKLGRNKKAVFRQYIIALGFPENQAENIMEMLLNA
ncbi:tellurite resistance TerB family protein [Methylomonas sp. MK1]|uniref:tellurite resistance TerB family protein n=1 Tax=Methylomonas sp. MK1 TaxID=1131552 RepID=UPI0003A5E549|nr:tellurite resistance TerB family protein [Methylomonas sp. MK1]